MPGVPITREPFDGKANASRFQAWQEVATMTRSYFHTNRLFHLYSPQGGGRGWYFEVREGAPRGSPIEDRPPAKAVRTNGGARAEVGARRRGVINELTGDFGFFFSC